MKLLSYVFSIFAAFVLLVAADTENYQIFAATAAASGVAINKVNRFAFYEYWHSQGGFPDCITGWSHVRLIVGKVVTTGAGLDFRATAFDMVKQEEDPTKVAAFDEPWLANQYEKDGVWRRVSQDSQYASVQKVATGKTDNIIKNIGDEYCRKWPDYSVVRNSCLNYANYMMAQITN